MVDTRFHYFSGARTLASLLKAAGIDASLDGDGPLIEGAEELHLAGPGCLSLAAQADYRQALEGTGAAAVIVSDDLLAHVPAGTVAIAVPDPHMAFVAMLDQLYPESTRGAVTGLLGPHEQLPQTEKDVRLGPGVVLGPGVEIGRGTIIGPNTVIGPGVTIGRNVTIGANCTVECAHIGNGVVLHSGARIGSEGFGWLDHGRSNRKIPQLGRVILQDRVEIGANTTVDRGALGDTVIGEGTKIDNLCQIAHNCRIGRNCLLAGMVGLAGSTVIEDSVMIGGGAVAAGHIVIGTGSIVLARSFVTKDVKRGGRVGGSPAQDVHAWRRETATLRMLTKGKKSGREI